ncbi:regulatory protein [Streptomyces albus]|uniref:Regulatory protein n=1 Tax=Streptomyces albus (strain ATCC 21838 / DSM 41398 / FERM P-419 / JCM 4703 / NBRC 107858) TaxID=1081613 RepID=A0A0B5EMG3_STRA4|nr:regulatory protein [Streptomyces albus]AOU74862.1 regulatory protein [Streptomyces albus]AYN30671.1 regulatory protein [Streptomyces albus]
MSEPVRPDSRPPTPDHDRRVAPSASRQQVEHWFGLSSLRTNIRVARDTVREKLHVWQLPGEVCADAVLLVCELVTNAVVHSGSSRVLCGLSLTSHGRLRIEVHDEGGTAIRRPDNARPGPEDESGRGLLIVQQLADSWGTARSTRTGGKAVWAVLRFGL